MRLLLASTLAALLTGLPASASPGRDCTHGPPVHPGKKAPTQGHFERCKAAPTPEPPPPEPPPPQPQPEPEPTPPSVTQPPASPAAPAAPTSPRRDGGKPEKRPKTTPPPKPPVQVAGEPHTALQLPSREERPGWWAVALSLLIGAGCAAAVVIGSTPGPPPTFDLRR